MRKYLLFAALLMVTYMNVSRAQGLFTAPDTVCMRQKVQLKSNVPNATSHFWGFCSGYIFDKPVGTDMGSSFGFDGATAIEVEKDGDNYYAFVLNAGPTNSFIRLEFGASLDNVPRVTNYGNMNGVLPLQPSSLHIVKDTVKGNWHVFVVGGSTIGNSALARMDFGKSLANTPNIVNFGNYDNLLENPVGLFIAKESKKWFGYTFNRLKNELIKIEFDTLLSFTPVLTNLGVVGNITGPNDYAPIRHNGIWYFFVTNETNSNLTRVAIGSSLETPVVTSALLGNFTNELRNPTGIPTGLTRAIRHRDNIFMFSTNQTDNILVKIKFQQCSNASIQSSTTAIPPVYTYDTAGIYNLYYMVNEGLPDMQAQCKLIYVLPTPPITMSNDTSICAGDTISLKVLSVNAINKTWSPAYNISSTTVDEVRIWPRYSTTYRIFMPYLSGCTVDTAIKVTVAKVKSDAGPDRTLDDGATTLVGGPFTSVGTNYTYKWTPDRYISSTGIANPTVYPPFDYTYYLTVTDENSGCKATDTVVVNVGCNGANLPNAFIPEGNKFQNRFGLANSQIVKVLEFSVFDRWGRKVFTTTDATKEWDGKVNDQVAPMGVYVWIVDGFCSSGKRIQAQGNVTLIR